MSKKNIKQLTNRDIVNGVQTLNTYRDRNNEEVQKSYISVNRDNESSTIVKFSYICERKAYDIPFFIYTKDRVLTLFPSHLSGIFEYTYDIEELENEFSNITAIEFPIDTDFVFDYVTIDNLPD